MKRKILSLLLALVLLSALLPQLGQNAEASVVNGVCGAGSDKLNWTLDLETGAMTIAGSGAMTEYESAATTPWASYRAKVRSLTVEQGVSAIGAHAFESCVNLETVSLPDSLMAIGVDAFTDTACLKATEGETVSLIGGWVISAKPELTELELSEGTVGLADAAFAGCDRLALLTLPESLRSIGSRAFDGCAALSAVTIPEAVTQIGKEAFAGCTGLNQILTVEGNSAYVSQDGVLFNKAMTELIRYPAARVGSYEIPSTVTSIAEAAFRFAAITGVQFPDTLSTIGADAFADCTSLSAVALPTALKTLDVDAFDGCTALTSFTVPYTNADFAAEDGVLYQKNKTTLVLYPAGKSGSFTVPSAVTAIASGAFRNCTKLSSVTLPSKLSSLGDEAFAGCTGLTAVTFPESVSTVPKRCFAGCTGLREIAFGKGVKTIGDEAFRGCAALYSVTLPANVSSVGLDAFRDCYIAAKSAGAVQKGATGSDTGSGETTSATASDSSSGETTGSATGSDTNPGSSATGSDTSGGSGEVGTGLSYLTVLNAYCTIADSKETLGHPNLTLLHAESGSTTSTYASRYQYGFSAHKWSDWAGNSATCTEGGTQTRTCSVCSLSETKTTSALGHDYDTPGYTWNKDYTECTATSICKHNASHVIVETVKSTAEVTKKATCTAKGETTYTATFTNTRFAKQTKTVEDIPMTAHNYKDGVCTVCGAKEPAKADSGNTSPNTGVTLWVFIPVLLLALLAAAFSVKKIFR